jgi:hypothetical protein
MTYVGVNRSRKRKPKYTSCICGCGATKLHARGLAKRCYLRQYNQTPQRKLRRAEYIAANREQVLRSYRKYYQKKLSAKQLTYGDRVIPIAAKGWGYLPACR